MEKKELNVEYDDKNEKCLISESNSDLSPWCVRSGAFNYSNFKVPILSRAIPPFVMVSRKSFQWYLRSGKYNLYIQIQISLVF